MTTTMTTTTTTAARTWLQCPHPRPDAPARLVCFPHAGGSASFFRTWGADGAGLTDVEVFAVRYPGRAERLVEPPATDLRQLGVDIAAAVAEIADPDRPTALFGHSLGAAVALETARALEASGVAVAHLFASGSRDGAAPGVEELTATPVDDDAATVARLLELGGTDPELAADPEFQELVLPYVRADAEMFHAYRHRAQPALACPVTTIVGDADGDADRRPWRGLTEALREVGVRGDHFYLVDEPPHALVRRTLIGAVS